MKYSKWYDRDLKTSLLGFGCMRFKMDGDKIDEKKAQALIDKAYESGVNYFDTAVPYLDRQSEEFVGRALKKYDRSSFFLATKLPVQEYKTSEEVEKAIDAHLGKLQTDYIDFYLLHAMSKDRLKIVKELGIIDIVKKWKEQGKIRNFGFSFHDDYETFKEFLDLYDWDFCQIQFNYLDKDIQQGMQGHQDLVDRKIPIVVMEPLKGGKLVHFNESVESKLKAYSDDAIVKWAFRWVASQKGVMTILSGMNEMDQLEENLEIFSTFQPLNVEEEKLIDEVTKDLKELEVVGCTKCQYCMPCPAGVNIPGNFSIINEYEMFKNIGGAKWQYNNLVEKSADADACITCEECLPKCPQFIDIPRELIKVGDLMKVINK